MQNVMEDHSSISRNSANTERVAIRDFIVYRDVYFFIPPPPKIKKSSRDPSVPEGCIFVFLLGFDVQIILNME